MSNIKRTIAAVSMLLISVAVQAENRIDTRQQHQDARIERGVKSGSLTPQEAERLKRGQERIQKAEARALADGTISKGEARRIEHMQDRQSRALAHNKHDRQHDFNHNGKTDRPQRPAKR